jgi:UDP-hydrolysing UDP-N-acetyl-D-glucosamine 2-epimerase
LEYEQTEGQCRQLLAALHQCSLPIIFTMPNTDTNNHLIRKSIKSFIKTHPTTAQAIESMDPIGYFSLMAKVIAMVGNSSSGIIEAPSFHLPVVNIGTRQKGRICAGNVIHVDCDRPVIVNGIKKATSDSFRKKLHNIINPYGQGHAAEEIVKYLKKINFEDQLIVKQFHDIPVYEKN